MSENSSNSSGQVGNTKQPAPALKWCFTLNNYDQNDLDELSKIFSSKSSKYIIGKEVGEQGTPHLQGFVKFNDKLRLTALKKLYKGAERIHWEKTRGSDDDNYKYCSKENNFISFGYPKPVKTLSEDQLFDWQKDIINIIKQEPDDRTIYWIWESEGKKGKTTFCKYLSIKFGAIPIEGKKNDILYCASEFPSELYIFDFERSMEDYISYGAIEKIKNGYYMCAKYESKPIIRNNPHVLIFANFEPDYEKLSKDRWNIIDLNDNTLPVCNL